MKGNFFSSLCCLGLPASILMWLVIAVVVFEILHALRVI